MKSDRTERWTPEPQISHINRMVFIVCNRLFKQRKHILSKYLLKNQEPMCHGSLWTIRIRPYMLVMSVES